MKKKRQFKTFESYLKKQLKNPEFRAAFQEEGEKLKIAYEIAVLRNKAKLTQKELAKKLKVSQAAVARIESGSQNLTLDTLRKIGDIFKKKLTVKFV